MGVRPWCGAYTLHQLRRPSTPILTHIRSLRRLWWAAIGSGSPDGSLVRLLTAYTTAVDTKIRSGELSRLSSGSHPDMAACAPSARRPFGRWKVGAGACWVAESAAGSVARRAGSIVHVTATRGPGRWRATRIGGGIPWESARDIRREEAWHPEGAKRSGHGWWNIGCWRTRRKEQSAFGGRRLHIAAPLMGVPWLVTPTSMDVEVRWIATHTVGGRPK